MVSVKILAQQCVKEAEKDVSKMPDVCKQFYKEFFLNQSDVKMDSAGKIETSWKGQTEFREPKDMDVAWRSKMMKRALKELFPDAKFSVRLDRFSMGDSIDAEWNDGPAERTVEHTGITYMFEDIYRDDYGEILSGGNSYVSLRREVSPEKRAWAQNKIATEFNAHEIQKKFDIGFDNKVWRLLKRTDFRSKEPRVLEGEW